LCEDFSIKRFYEGSLRSNPTTAEDIFKIAHHIETISSLARKITSNALVDFAKFKLLKDDPSLLQVLEKVKGYRTQNIGFVTVDDGYQIGLDAETLKEICNDSSLSREEKGKYIDDFMKEGKEGDKEYKTKKAWFATQIKRLGICMADFIYMTLVREYNIEEVINTKEPKFFEIMTGITKDEFKKLCDLGLINHLALNKIVRDFTNKEESSLEPEKYIIECLEKKAS
jgi:hypothetical protein